MANVKTMVSVKFNKDTNIEGALSSADIRDIINRSADYFITNDDGIFTNLLKLNKRLKQIGQIIQNNYDIYVSSKSVLSSSGVRLRKGYTMDPKGKKKILADYFELKNQQRNTMTKQQLNKIVAEGYQLVMQLREALLGEKINYIIYIGDNKDPANVQALEVKEVNILKLLSVQATGMSIRAITNDLITEIQNIENKDDNIDTGYMINNVKTTFYQQFIPTILANDFEMKQDDNGTKYSVYQQLIRKELKNYERHLINKNTIDLGKHKQHRNRFTMGHISEAFDIGFDQLKLDKMKNPYYNYNQLREKFYDNLYFDSIKATRGGDNATDIKNQLSVKAFSASLYSIATIYGDMIQLTEMIDNALDGGVKARAKIQLENMFFEQSKYKKGEKNGEAAMKRALNKAFNLLEKSLNTK